MMTTSEDRERVAMMRAAGYLPGNADGERMYDREVELVTNGMSRLQARLQVRREETQRRERSWAASAFAQDDRARAAYWGDDPDLDVGRD